MVEGGGAGCTTDLGRVSGTVRRTGSWDGSCDSVLRPGSHARYYSFTLSGSSPVTIDLASSQDTFMALRAGSGTSGRVIETNDDGGSGNNSRIARTLSAGTYTIEATTYFSGRTGSFTLTLAVGGDGSSPDLVVELAASDTSLTPGQSFTLSATVRNRGDAESAAATLTYRRRQAGGSWIEVGTDSVGVLPPSGTSSESIGLTAPAEAGTYEYGACVSTVAGETDTANNCSAAIQVVVAEPPDLVVESPTVSDSSPTSGQSFTLSATVRNRGDAESAAATLTYRRRQAGGSWIEVGTDSVGRLPPSGTSFESIALTAPPAAGTYEYGACVSTVAGESDTANNCSRAVQVRVRACLLEALGSLTVGRRVAGSWGSGCESTHRAGRYARYYTFVVTRAVEVSISLASSTDTYLFLLAGSGTDGTVLASNDDGGDGTNSRIVRTLSAGTYTVEATTFLSGSTGSFTLRVSERRPFADDPVVAGMSIRALHLTELRGRIDELRVGVGLPRYSWADRTIRSGETRVSAVHWQQLRSALGEVYDADGRRRPQYTDAIRVGDPIEARHVNELRRAVEGL